MSFQEEEQKRVEAEIRRAYELKKKAQEQRLLKLKKELEKQYD